MTGNYVMATTSFQVVKNKQSESSSSRVSLRLTSSGIYGFKAVFRTKEDTSLTAKAFTKPKIAILGKVWLEYRPATNISDRYVIIFLVSQ